MWFIIYKIEVFKLIKNNNQNQWEQINPAQIGCKCIYIDQEVDDDDMNDLCKFSKLFLNNNISIIVVSQNCFCICQNILAHFGFSIFSILMDIKKPPSILAIESKNSNNFGYNFGHY